MNRVQASAVSNHLVKTASKSVHPFGWNFVNKKTSDTHTHTNTHTQTNCSENITPPPFLGGVKKNKKGTLRRIKMKTMTQVKLCLKDADYSTNL